MTTTYAMVTATSRRSIIARNDDNKEDSDYDDDYGVDRILAQLMDKVQYHCKLSVSVGHNNLVIDTDDEN